MRLITFFKGCEVFFFPYKILIKKKTIKKTLVNAIKYKQNTIWVLP